MDKVYQHNRPIHICSVNKGVDIKKYGDTRRGYKETIVVTEQSVAGLNEERKKELKKFFKRQWNRHIKNGCRQGFGCEKKHGLMNSERIYMKKFFMAKKCIVISFLVFLLCGCTADNDSEPDVIIVDDVDIENTVGTYPVEGIVDAKMAVNIGDAIIKAVYGNEITEETRVIIQEINGKNMFVVSRIPKDEMLGGDYNVAISKTNGAILKVWAGE